VTVNLPTLLTDSKSAKHCELDLTPMRPYVPLCVALRSLILCGFGVDPLVQRSLDAGVELSTAYNALYIPIFGSG
jgi:hypothetical protein